MFYFLNKKMNNANKLKLRTLVNAARSEQYSKCEVMLKDKISSNCFCFLALMCESKEIANLIEEEYLNG